MGANFALCVYFELKDKKKWFEKQVASRVSKAFDSIQPMVLNHVQFLKIFLGKNTPSPPPPQNTISSYACDLNSFWLAQFHILL